MKTHVYALIFFLCFGLNLAFACNESGEHQQLIKKWEAYCEQHKDATCFRGDAIEAACAIALALKGDFRDECRLKIGSMDLSISQGIVAKDVIFITPGPEQINYLTQADKRLLGAVVRCSILGHKDISGKVKIWRANLFLDERQDADLVYFINRKS